SSLWPGSGSLFADNKARQVGDLVTIIIVERNQATSTAQTQTSQDASVNFGPSLWNSVPLIPGLGVSSKGKFQRDDSTTRCGSLNARMTAKVVDVLTNGNLVIEGRQTIIVIDEEQVFVVSGVILPQDIAPDNTVLSTYVADATINYQGAGVIGDKQEPGLLTRLLNWLF